MRWRRRAHEVPDDLDELDPFLLSMIDRLATARTDARAGDDDWVAMEKVAALTARMAETAQSALVSGWDRDAESRMLIERREGPAGVEVRLSRRAREILGPVLRGGE
jgi:predicted RNA-binding Zn ribbon-like protein